ncbi:MULTISPECIES: DNA cytosine methyltransferase [Butyricimonas]|uniref:DNA cytosine methyltransferase n=1 Tax=Butyricimonas TaxID=574697 RepID=UPI001D097438|nr:MULTISPECIES: DNA cytosine methyltransferase [Butyricimonas]MBS5624660.1 DNA cytosine methyltransferase [Porphyromonadaceae bacterium]MCB6972559.1 DNA cytosine methyltransferase [Butyricimonas synergistica]MCG4519567.1 DNA cytosine methyltransferase [Butyricimonas sp. DFI.6.44]
MIHASLCTGIGACELAATWMEWENAFSCEVDEFCNTVLKYYYPNSKHYGNIFEQDFKKWRGRIDILTAGFPCQPFSIAGARGGSEDDRYLWPEVLRVINEIRPSWFVGENVSGITSMVFPGEEVTVGRYTDVFGESYKETEMREQFIIDQICNDLESINYSVQPIIIPACAVGAPHRRDRVWFIANRADTGVEGLQREGKDCIYAIRYPTHATEAGLQERLDDGKQEDTEEIGAGQDDRLERHGGKRTITDPNGERCNYGSDNREERRVRGERERDVTEDKPKWDERERGVGEDGTVITNTDSKGLSTISFPHGVEKKERGNEDGCPVQHTCNHRETHETNRWQNFPTQSPVCGRDARLPFDVHHLAIPYGRWREWSIKSYGNTMVPQVVYEIFRAIEQVEKMFNENNLFQFDSK